tara:strand:- start:168 stop:374 length:207 start_codon:yes stop_codon:yes gene_type:complete
MSKYYLELFTSDGRYIIKDSEGNVVSDEPLARKEARAAVAKLNNVKAPVAEKKKKVKKSKKVKSDEEE